MNILIAGKSGTGKSNLGDIIRNGIFKADKNSRIKTNDTDRQVKEFGSGKNVYNLIIRKTGDIAVSGLDANDLEQDVIIILRGGEFKKRYNSLRS